MTRLETNRDGRILRVLLMLAIGFMPLVAEAEQQLVFGLYTSDKPTEMVRRFRPVLDVLEESMSHRLGQPVAIKTQVFSSYDKGIAGLAAGEVDFVRFGAASYVLAKQKNPDIVLLAMEESAGKKEFSGVICVHEDSPIVQTADLRGKRFAFGSERSTLGRFLAQEYLYRNGLRAPDLAEFAYLDRHDKVGSAVASGLFDAGALKEGTFNKLVAGGKPLRILAKIPVVTKPWVARAGLPIATRESLRDSLLDMTSPEALKAIKKTGFQPTSDAEYEAVRLAMQASQKFF